jgi:hypothetical protein
MTVIMQKKTEISETQKIWDEFKNYSTYEDMKELYSKVLPPLSTFEDKMLLMSSEYEQAKEIIGHYDEIISEKANKTTITELYHFME